MSNFSSIVAEKRRFENVRLLWLPDRAQENGERHFVPADQARPLRLAVIDQAEDLLLRFIRLESEVHPNSSARVNPTTNGQCVPQQSLSQQSGFQSPSGGLQQNGNNHNLHPSIQNLHIGEKIIHEMTLYRESEYFPFSSNCFVINECLSQDSNPNSKSSSQTMVMIQFGDKNDRNRFSKLVQDFKRNHLASTFNQRTDAASASQYFQFYGYLSQQQNMMQDYVRTSTYQRAIHANSEDFKGKVVLDVGAGSGILSFFAVQAGARKVYAIEASSMAKYAQLLVQSNNFGGKIEVIAGKVEEIELPEPVDIILSEPMGYMLLNERMLETYLHAKKWFRSPEQGRMFPSRGDLHIAPFTDAQLYLEQTNKANFWYAKDFHGVDLRALHSAATNEYFKQPIVDTFDIRICMARTVRHVIDFQKAHETDLHCISIPLEFIANQTGHIHGLAFWFDVAFIGSAHTVWLSTAPSQPLTHWYQVRCLLITPLFVNKGQKVNGSCVLRANKRQSYDVDIELFIESLGTRSSNTLDLKNPCFRYTGAPIQPPPGLNETSPSEQAWSAAPANVAFDPYQQVANNPMAAVAAQLPMGALTNQATIPAALQQMTAQQHQSVAMMAGNGTTTTMMATNGPAPVLTPVTTLTPVPMADGSSMGDFNGIV